MISHTSTGFPRPVGTPFRWRRIYAAAGYTPGEDMASWTVSVIDTKAGPVIEARPSGPGRPVIVTDLDSHGSSLPDVIVKTKAVLADGLWKEAEVTACTVAGCPRPRPMWAVRNQMDDDECLWCQLRTVLECVKCGAPDTAHYINREALLAAQLCFACKLWHERSAETDPARVIVEDGTFYTIGTGTGPKEYKGYGGTEWTITWTDPARGVTETDDLWYGGEIPDWFRGDFPVNARLKRKASPCT